MKYIMILLIMILFLSGGSVYAGHPEDNEVKINYRDMDQNDDGKITVKEWRKAFITFDWDGDGVLSGEEVRPGAVRSDVDSAYRDEFRLADSNGNKVISPSEWAGTMQEFNRHDQDRNGELSVDEFHKRAGSDQFGNIDQNSDEIISRDEWHNTDRSFEALDLNRNEKLTRDEFYDTRQYTVSVFRELDIDNDERISYREWRSTDESFSALDTNGDKYLSEGEFNARQSESIMSQLFRKIFTKK